MCDYSPTTILLTLLLGIFTIWSLQYHWKRRKLYKMARRRPGPLALPLIGSAFYLLGSSRDVFETIFKFATKFESPTPLWLGPHLFFVIWEPKDLKIVLNSQDALEKCEFYKYIESAMGYGLISHRVAKWRKHRKMIMPIFNQNILNDFVQVFFDQSQVLVEQLESQLNRGSFDVFDYISRFAMDVLCETGMGVVPQSQTFNSDHVKWFNKGKDIAFARINNVFYQFDFIFNLSPLSTELDEVIDKIQMFVGAAVTKQIQNWSKASSKQNHTDRTTFLQKLIEISENDKDFTEKDLQEEVSTFIIAGNDTMTSTLSYALIMLGMYPEIQEKLFMEIVDCVGLHRPVQYADLAELKYTERVIRETLRLFPPAPAISRKVDKDIQLENCVAPAGCSIAIAIVALHRNPDVWTDPLKFDPQRFLVNGTTRHPYAWIPFSGGPRNCIAHQYALMAMKVAIATLIRHYRFSTEYKSVDDIKFEAGLLLTPANGYKISIELRK